MLQINITLKYTQLKNVNQVNKWCDNKTHGKIKIIDKLDGNIFMIILNVVNFKGIWLKNFLIN